MIGNCCRLVNVSLTPPYIAFCHLFDYNSKYCMTNDLPITIEELTATKENVVHIARHHVTLDEVHQALAGDYAVGAAKLGRHKIIGVTDAGRCLAVIVARTETANRYQLVTARTAERAERHAYITFKLGGTSNG
jgi:hypothetical protein